MSNQSSFVAAGLMSGSSLDGTDYTVVRFTAESLREPIPAGGRDRNHFEWLLTDERPYPQSLTLELKSADQLPHREFLELEYRYSNYLGEMMRDLNESLPAQSQPTVIGIHGHTVFHEPQKGFSLQMGSGSAIARKTASPVCLDFRNAAIAAGGEGAPMAPIVDALFTEEYSVFLNLGGIANLSVFDGHGALSFDVCACNQLLNFFAEKKGQKMDEGGRMASGGNLNRDLLRHWEETPYLRKYPPKSLSNQQVRKWFIDGADNFSLSAEDGLRSACEHIAVEIQTALKQILEKSRGHPGKTILVSGGGAKNDFLMQCIEEKLNALDMNLKKADPVLLDFKEALLMARMAALRWGGTPNFVDTKSGEGSAVVGGALYLPPYYKRHG
ncbi:MAG: hypothetical protein EA411_11140 [Saprospirales bacterium]|nr:MAG: hypothetical protein EA411_11140 [Saprospirales bacterium]